MKKYILIAFTLSTIMPVWAAEQAAAAEEGGFSMILRQGGNTLLVLIALSIFFVAIAAFLLLTLRREVLSPNFFLKEAERVASDQDIEALQTLCRGNSSPSASIIGVAAEEVVLNPDASYHAVRDAVEDEGSRQAGALWQRIQYLMDIAVVAPMIGLLGTVLGMLEAFGQMKMGVGVKPVHLADGVSKALITTAAGLILGIAAMLVHSYFRGRVNDLISHMENRCGRVLRIFTTRKG